MTNKPEMVSVSRELLERVEGTKNMLDYFEAMTELRALLAAPPEDVRAVGEEPVAIGALMRDCDERIVFESSGEVHIWDGMEVFSQPQRPKAPTIDFNEEILLPCPPGVRVGFCGDVKLSFDGAEYRGRAWLMEQGGKEEWVAIEGPENARKAGEALIAWAEAWEDKNDA